MAAFRPFDLNGIPIEHQPMAWTGIVNEPYDKMRIDAYTRTRIILMNGIENNSVLTSHAMHRMCPDPEIKRQLAAIRRADSQHQQVINWLNPIEQSIIETTVAYEQVAVDLTANLARNEPDPYVRQTLDFALLEDFDHLFRFSCLLELMEGKDPESITQGRTEIKPGRPTIIEHRHPDDSMRKHYDRNDADIKTKLNYWTITSGEQQTEVFYKSNGHMFAEPLPRLLYAEIAEIEEQHVTQYGALGDPNETMLEKEALIQLNEAYLYYSNLQTETVHWMKPIWERLLADEIGHVAAVNDLLMAYEHRDVQDIMGGADRVDTLVVFEENKDYVNCVLEEQVDLAPVGRTMEYVRTRDLPDDWPSFLYQRRVNAGGVPSEMVVDRHGGALAQRANDEPAQRALREMNERAERALGARVPIAR
jgi:Mn-containing catalase